MFPISSSIFLITVNFFQHSFTVKHTQAHTFTVCYYWFVRPPSLLHTVCSTVHTVQTVNRIITVMLYWYVDRYDIENRPPGMTMNVTVCFFIDSPTKRKLTFFPGNFAIPDRPIRRTDIVQTVADSRHGRQTAEYSKRKTLCNTKRKLTFFSGNFRFQTAYRKLNIASYSHGQKTFIHK
jgi:hypothetical protein